MKKIFQTHPSRLLLCLLFTIILGGNFAWGETTATIKFGSGTGSTNVNSASITGEDSQSNSWTITTVGTTSFTPNASYAQVGSSNKPATSITFTTTLSEDVNVTAFSAKFGGFSGTAGTVTLKVGDTAVGTGSLNASNDVTVSSTSIQTGKVLTVTVTGISKGVKCYNISYTYKESAPVPAYEITAQSNNDSWGTVSLSSNVITATPETGYTYANPAYTVSPANSATVAQNGDEFTVTPTENTTVTINFVAIPKHTVTFSVNGVTTSAELIEGADINFPDDPASIEGKVFCGWVAAVIDGTTDVEPTFVTSATMGEGDVTYYAVFADVIPGTSKPVNDKLTRTTTGVTGTSYSNWSGKTATSDAVYAGNSAGGNGSIQLRSDNNNSGLVTTTSGGKVKNIIVTWNESTSASRTINIYGKNSAYEAASDLYDNNKQGTLLGTLAKGSTTLAVTGDYEYVGIRSASGALYLEDITITWDAGTPDTYSDYCTTVVVSNVAKPEITVAENPFLFSTTATITCETDGATIYYSYDGETWTEYTEALTITETKTIYAKATKDSDESKVASVTATKNLAEPTVTVSGDLALDLDGETNVAAGTLTASVKYNDAAVDGATVTWESSDTDVATIDASGAVTLLTTGTVTFTATYAGDSNNYASATGTKTITVIDTNAPGSTAENPYTVAQAIAATPASGTSSNVYIHGIVSAFYNTSIVGDGSNYRYYISDDGTTTTQLLVYKGKKNSTDNFSSADDLQIGDVVTIYGGLTTYNSIKEVASGNYIVSLFRKAENTITVTGGTSFTIDRNANESSLTFAATAASNTTVTYTVDTSNTTLASSDYSLSGSTLTVTGTSAGTITITASAAGNSEYKDGETTITVTVFGVKDDPTIVVNASETIAYGSTFTVDDSMIEGGAITVTSGNTNIATVSGLVITPQAVGTTTITVTTAENTYYNAGSETFELTVTAPEGKTTAAPSTSTIFSETFAGCTGTGGNDNSWSGSIASNTLNADNTEWTFSNGSGASACAKFGSGSKKGSATTPALGAAGTLSLSFRAGAWDGGSEGTTLKLSVSEGNISETSVTLTKGEFNTYTATITNATAATTITFEAQNASNNRFFLDDIVVTQEGETITATLNASGYATFCSEYPLDFSDYETAGYSAWQITGVNGEKITFSQITGSIKGGQGILLKGTAGKTVELTSANSTTTLDGNLLKGTLAPTYVATGEYYGLSGNQFVKVNAGTVPAGKALLPASALSGNVKAFTFVFEDDATGIEETLSNSPLKGENIYNLAGQMVNGKSVNGKLPKGIYIVNGKKILK